MSQATDNTGGEIGYSAQEYSANKETPGFRIAVERHTITELLGDMAGLRILDAGCGDGVYSRMMADRGAGFVRGVDRDSGMVALAREKSADYKGRIEYIQSFMEQCAGNGDCDAALGAYVLNYAKTWDQLCAMCKAVASHLRTGGRWIIFNNNPFEVYYGIRYAKYGFRKTMYGGDSGLRVIYDVEGLSQPIVNYYLPPADHESAFKQAGFSWRWYRAALHPSERGDPHWEEFFAANLSPYPSPFIAAVCTKEV